MKRTSLLCRLVVLSLVFVAADVGFAADDRPNVLLIAIDDLNDWVGCLEGHPQAKTPHLDRLADRGVLFTGAHCQAPICNPSRTSIMLGLRPSTTGVYVNRPRHWQVPELRKRTTLTRCFADADYDTLTTGKIYHGSGMPPGDFDTVGPRPGQRIKLDRRIQEELSGLWDFGPQTYEEEKFGDYVDASWAIDQLSEEREKPFFMAVGFYRPHVPLYAPASVFERFPRSDVSLPPIKENDRDDLPEAAKKLTANPTPPPHSWFVENDKWKDAVRAFLASTAWTDQQVGRLLNALDAGPHAENTIVVLYSDHGFFLGEKERWAKQSLWERATRVPFIIAGPGVEKGGRCSRPVELLSIYPTLAELCGLEAPNDLEGESLAPLLKDSEAPWRRPAITTYQQNNHAVRSERYRYIRYADGSEELYDHKHDPHEWNNLAGDPQYASIIREHAQWLPEENAPPARRGR